MELKIYNMVARALCVYFR